MEFEAWLVISPTIFSNPRTRVKNQKQSITNWYCIRIYEDALLSVLYEFALQPHGPIYVEQGGRSCSKSI